MYQIGKGLGALGEGFVKYFRTTQGDPGTFTHTGI